MGKLLLPVVRQHISVADTVGGFDLLRVSISMRQTLWVSLTCCVCNLLGPVVRQHIDVADIVGSFDLLSTQIALTSCASAYSWAQNGRPPLPIVHQRINVLVHSLQARACSSESLLQ